MQRGFVASGDQWAKSTFQFDTRYPELEFYGQDTGRSVPISRSDIGLRWKARLAPSTPSNNILVPNQAMVAGAAPSNTVKWVPGDLFKNQFNNWARRWASHGIRSGKARRYSRQLQDRVRSHQHVRDRIDDSANAAGLGSRAINTDFGQSGGRLRSIPELTPPTAKPSSLTQPVAFGSGSNTVIDPNLKAPTTHQWDFNIQHEIARNTILDIAYVGRRAYHLLGAYNANQNQIYNNGFLDAFKTVKAGGESH